MLGLVVGVLLTGLVLPFAIGDRGRPAATAGVLSTGASGAGAAAATGSTIAGGGTAVTAPAAGGPSASGAKAGKVTTAGAGGSRAAATTDTAPVKVGFSLFQVSGAASIGFVINVDPKQEQAVYQVFVDYLNSTGGINGRKIEPVYSTYDLLDQNSQNASCLALTQDAKVFAVVGGYNFTSADACVVDQNKTLLFNNNSFTTDELYRSGRHVSIFAKASRMMTVFARRMTESGQIRGKKVGILDDLGADPDRSVLAALSAAVKANGGEVVRESVLSADLATGSSQIPVEVSQMHTSGAETVLLIPFGLYGTQFVQQADSQKWTPVYGATDWQAWYSDVAASNMPASFDGSYSITTTRTGEVTANIPEPPQASVCRQIYEKTSGSKVPPRGQDTYGLTMIDCDTMLAFAAGARSAGAGLTYASFLAGIQRLGAIPEAGWGGGSFGPGKLDLNDQTRINRWSKDCKCWKPTTPFTGS